MAKASDFRKDVGNMRHQDCQKCKGKKVEHVFVEKPGFVQSTFGWECISCGHFLKIYTGY